MGSSEVKGDWVLRWPERKRVTLMPSRDMEARVIEAGRTQPQIKMNSQRARFDGVIPEVVSSNRC